MFRAGHDEPGPRILRQKWPRLMRSATGSKSQRRRAEEAMMTCWTVSPQDAERLAKTWALRDHGAAPKEGSEVSGGPGSRRLREEEVKRFLIAFAITATALTSARADSLPDMAQFAQSICGDIPAGSLTRTSIQGQVKANAGLLAKIITGDVNVSGSKTAEIYKGIPFDKLPETIPTVSMCKLELVKLLLSQKTQTQNNNAPGGIIQSGTGNTGTVTNNNNK